MMKFAQLLVGFYLLQTATVAQKSSLKPFTLTGVIKGMDSGYIYLNYIPDGGHGILDSCKVINGKFLFKGHLSEPTKANLQTFGFNGIYDEGNMTDFFIEPGKMTIYGTFHHLRSLNLIGSASDSDRVRLNKSEYQVNNLIKLVIDSRKLFWDQYKIEKKIKSDSSSVKKLLHKIDSLNNLELNLSKEKDRIDSVFIANNPNSFVAIDKLYHLTNLLEFSSLISLYDRFSESLKKSIPGRELKHTIDKESVDPIGSDEKDFIAIDDHGDTIRLENYKGKKYVLLDFGASWCAPCKRIIPYLKAEYDKYSTVLEIISISNQDEIDDWRKGIKEDNTKWPQIIENKMIRPLVPIDLTITDMYYIDAIPSLILIDKSGKIVNKYGGFYNSKSAFLLDLDAQLKKIYETERDILNK